MNKNDGLTEVHKNESLVYSISDGWVWHACTQFSDFAD